MNLDKSTFVILCIFFSSCIFSQEAEKSIPISIYTNKAEFIDLNSTFNIHEKLNLTNFKFMVLDVKTIAGGAFTIPLYKINSPSMFIYETYNKVYQTEQLEKSFFKVTDLYKVRSIDNL